MQHRINTSEHTVAKRTKPVLFASELFSFPSIIHIFLLISNLTNIKKNKLTTFLSDEISPGTSSPAAATVIAQDQDFAEIVFNIPGEYEVGIITRRGDCEATQLKTILVIEGEDFPQDPAVSQHNTIEEFIVYPNPSNGNFSVQITLKKAGSINIKVFGLANNALLANVSAHDTLEYDIAFDLAPLPLGLYVVVLETPFGSQVRKIIVE